MAFNDNIWVSIHVFCKHILIFFENK
jgi:hypothetical protein